MDVGEVGDEASRQPVLQSKASDWGTNGLGNQTWEINSADLSRSLDQVCHRMLLILYCKRQETTRGDVTLADLDIAGGPPAKPDDTTRQIVHCFKADCPKT